MMALEHNTQRRGLTAAAFATALAAGWSGGAAEAGEWRIVPFVELRQAFTDNARSAPTGEEADLITTTTAGVGVRGQGARVRLNFDYGLSRDQFWDNSELSGFRHSLAGFGDAELWREHLFVDARAAISQSSLTRRGGTTAAGRTAGTGDQELVVNYAITPRFLNRFGGFAFSEVRYTFNEVRFLDADVGAANVNREASRNHSLLFSLRSGTDFTRLRWEALASKTFAENDTDRELQELFAEYALYRWIAPRARVGRETIEGSGENAQGDPEFYGLGGFTLTPGPRTSLTFEAGYRYGGASFSGDLLYRVGAQTTFRAAYSEAVRSDRQRLAANLFGLGVDETGQFIDELTGLPATPNQFLFDFQDRTLKEDNLVVSLVGTRGRNNFTISAFASNREDQATADEEFVVGSSVGITRRIRPAVTGGVNASYSNTLETRANTPKDYIVRGGAFLSWRMMEKLTASLNYSYLLRDSENPAADLQENFVSVTVRKEF